MVVGVELALLLSVLLLLLLLLLLVVVSLPSKPRIVRNKEGELLLLREVSVAVVTLLASSAEVGDGTAGLGIK